MPEYTLWLTDDKGVRLAGGPIDYAYKFTCTKIANGIGRAVFELPPYFDRTLLAPDNMIQVWRAPDGGRLAHWNTYLIDQRKFWWQGPDQRITIPGSDMMDILRRRIVAYYAGSTYAKKSATAADDIMKEIVTENFISPVEFDDTSTTDTDRVLSSYLSVAADLSDGPTLSRGCAWDNVLDALQSLANAAKQAGNEIFFAIVPDVIGSNSMTWKFVTRTGQPGADRTTGGTNPMVFSLERGNLRNPVLTENYRDEANYIYAGGRGEMDARNIQTAEDSTRSKRSIWGRREDFAYALTQGETDAPIQDVADEKLEEWRPVITFKGEIVTTDGSIPGKDWNWGDKVTAKDDSIEFDCIIRRMQITVEDNAEKIDADLEYQE